MAYRPSKLGYAKLCPHFEYMPTDEDDDNTAASKGTLLHEAYATGCMAGLSTEEAQAIDAARGRTESLIAAMPGPVRQFSEIELRYTPLHLKGTADLVLIGADGKGVVSDLKTGPAGLPDDADESIQNYCYILGVYEKFPEVVAMDGMLFNPITRDFSERVMTVRADIPVIEAKLKALIDIVEDRMATPTDGSHCKLCRYIARCQAVVPSVMQTAVGIWAPTPAILDPTHVLTEEERSVRAVIRQRLEAWCTAVKDDDNASGITPPGWRRIDKANPPKLDKVNRAEAVQRFLNLGLAPVVVYGCMRPTLGDLVEALQITNGVSKDEAKETIHGAIADLTTTSRTSYLMRAKGKDGVSDEDLVALLQLNKGGNLITNGNQ